MDKTKKNKAFHEFVHLVKANPHQYYAIKNGLHHIKEMGVEMNSKGYQGQTLLHLAVKLNDCRLIKLFVQNGCLVDLANDLGDTPLHKAVNENKLNAVKTLVSLGSDLDMGAEFEQTALHLAVIIGNMEIVKYLVDHGADIYLLDENNNYPIDYAIDEGDSKMIKYFLSKQDVDETRMQKIERIFKEEGKTNARNTKNN